METRGGVSIQVRARLSGCKETQRAVASGEVPMGWALRTETGLTWLKGHEEQMRDGTTGL